MITLRPNVTLALSFDTRQNKRCNNVMTLAHDIIVGFPVSIGFEDLWMRNSGRMQ